MDRDAPEGVHGVIEPIKEALTSRDGRIDPHAQPFVSEFSQNGDLETSQSVTQDGLTHGTSSGLENLGSMTSTATPGVVGLAQSLGSDSAAIQGQSNNPPSLTQFYAEIDDQASREASPAAGPSLVAGMTETDQNVTMIIDETEEVDREEPGGETTVTIDQTDIQETTVTSTEVESVAATIAGPLTIQNEANVEQMEVEGSEQVVQEDILPVESALANLGALNPGPLIDPTIVAENRASVEENANESTHSAMRLTSAQQDLIDAVRDTAEGVIPIGGATLEEDDRPDDVPRGLVFSEAEIRHGIRIKPISDLLSNLTDPVLIQEAHLMLERGKTPDTYYRIDTRLNEHYEEDLAEYERLEEARAAKVRKDKAAQTNGFQDETVRALVAIDAEDVPDIALPTLALNAEAGSSVERIPGLVQKKPAPSPVEREIRIDIKTLHLAQLYNLEAFRRRTLKEPPLEVTMLEYITTKSLRKQTPPPKLPTPPPASPVPPKKSKAERDAEKAEEQRERDRLAGELKEAMAQEEREQPLPDDPRDDAYVPQDEAETRGQRPGRAGSEEEDGRYERMPHYSCRRSGPSRASQRGPHEFTDLDADAAPSQPRKRGRPPKVRPPQIGTSASAAIAQTPRTVQPKRRGPGRPRKEVVASSPSPTGRRGNRPLASRPIQQLDIQSDESRGSDMDFGPDNDEDGGFEFSPVGSISPPRRSGRSGNAVLPAATSSASKKRARSPEPESEEETQLVRRTRQRVQEQDITVSERPSRETRSRRGRDEPDRSANDIVPTSNSSRRNKVEQRPARGTGQSSRGRASGKHATKGQGRDQIPNTPEARPTRSAAKGTPTLPVSATPEIQRTTRGQAAAGGRTSRLEGRGGREEKMLQTPARPSRTSKQTPELEPRRSRRNQSPDVRKARSRQSPRAISKAATTPKLHRVEAATTASKRASRTVVGPKSSKAQPASPAVKPKASHTKQIIQPPVRKRAEPVYLDGQNLVKGTFKLEVLVDRMAKKTARLFVKLDLPPLPDGSPIRRPYDGLQEGSARRQALASSEIDPMEDVDQALLNAARQGIDSDGSPSPIKSKEKQGRTEEDEITVNYESEDGYGSRAGSVLRENDDVEDGPVEDSPDADFEDSFAFLM